MSNLTCTRIETDAPCGAKLVYHNRAGEEIIALSLTLEGAIRYQPLDWRHRLARAMYYPTLKRFYRELRRNGVTQRSLHHLAGGAHRGRHGGWAIRTEGHRAFQAWLAQARTSIDLSRRHLDGATAAQAASSRDPAHAA